MLNNVYTKYIFYKIPFLKDLRKKLNPPNKKNITDLYQEIESHLLDFNDKIFPFFGTLLSIYRDQAKYFQHDFDFAFIKEEVDFIEIIKKLSKKGFKLTKISYVMNKKICAVTFLYKGVGVDFFSLETTTNYFLHFFPDFRNSKEKAQLKNNIFYKKFPRFFEVKYPAFSLIKHKNSKLKIPSNSKEIFKIHYGKNWQTPLDQDFIDYKYYKFIKKSSGYIFAKQKKLLEFFNL